MLREVSRERRSCGLIVRREKSDDEKIRTERLAYVGILASIAGDFAKLRFHHSLISAYIWRVCTTQPARSAASNAIAGDPCVARQLWRASKTLKIAHSGDIQHFALFCPRTAYSDPGTK